jgi:fatty acid desaturase
MKKNLGIADRIIRVVLALIIGALLISGTYSTAATWILGIVAVVLAGTALISFCPAYWSVGISSAGKKSE